jgi:hypothetical protein
MEILDTGNIKWWINSDLQRGGSGLFQDTVVTGLNLSIVIENVAKYVCFILA